MWRPYNSSSVSEISRENWLVRLAKTGSWGSTTDHTSIYKVESDWERYQISILGSYTLICLCMCTHMHVNLHTLMESYIYEHTCTYIWKKTLWEYVDFLWQFQWSPSISIITQCLSFWCCEKHHDQTQFEKEKVYFILHLLVCHV